MRIYSDATTRRYPAVGATKGTGSCPGIWAARDAGWLGAGVRAAPVCVHIAGAYRVHFAPMDVGIRELRGRLSDYLALVREGNEVVVTDRGAAFARIVPIKGGRALDRAIAEGIVVPALRPGRARPARRVKSRGSVSDLVSEQRR